MSRPECVCNEECLELAEEIRFLKADNARLADHVRDIAKEARDLRKRLESALRPAERARQGDE